MFSRVRNFYKTYKEKIVFTVFGVSLFSSYQMLKYNPEKEFKTNGVCMMKFDSSNNEEIMQKFKQNYLTFSDYSGVESKDYYPKDQMIRIKSSLVKELVEASYEIHSMCLEAVNTIVKDDVLLDLFEIPDDLKELCRDSWEKRETDCMGRFDFIYNGKGKPKLLEYNADTPTLLIESGIAQRIMFNNRIKEVNHEQFNFIESALTKYWENFFNKYKSKINNVAIIGDRDSEEDKQTTDYMLKFMKNADPSMNVKAIDAAALKYDNENNFAYSQFDTKYDLIWKLYPYEWLENEEFGQYFEDMTAKLKTNSLGNTIDMNTKFIEPPWKLILSSKALLPFLWQMYPNHPNLLPAYFEDPVKLNPSECHQLVKDLENNKRWVCKTKFGREGNNIKLVDYSHKDTSNLVHEVEISNDHHEKIHFGEKIYQAYESSVICEKYFLTFGSWIINGLPYGLGIRISDTWITKHDSSFVSHYFKPNETFEFSASEQQVALRKELYGEDEMNFSNAYGSFRKFIKLPSEINHTTHLGRGYHSTGGSIFNTTFYRNANQAFQAKKNVPNPENHAAASVHATNNASTTNTPHGNHTDKGLNPPHRKRVETGKTSRNYSIRS